MTRKRYRDPYYYSRNRGYGWFGYRDRGYDRFGRYGYWGPSYYCYYGAFGFFYPTFFGAGYDYGHSYYPRTRRGYRPRVIHVDDYSGAVGALDLDVSPEKAEIYIDGHYVGVADRFDGFPAYLWLEQGTYDVAIYRDGYETIFRQYTIRPGIVIDVEDRMQRGESVHPQDVEPPTRAPAAAPAPAAETSPPKAASPSPPSAGGEDGIGRALLSVRPSDAAIYLNGHFLGTAEEVAGLRSGLVIDPGSHVLEISRPGYETRRVELEVAAGEKLDLQVDLEKIPTRPGEV